MLLSSAKRSGRCRSSSRIRMSCANPCRSPGRNLEETQILWRRWLLELPGRRQSVGNYTPTHNTIASQLFHTLTISQSLSKSFTGSQSLQNTWSSAITNRLPQPLRTHPNTTDIQHVDFKILLIYTQTNHRCQLRNGNTNSQRFSRM